MPARRTFSSAQERHDLKGQIILTGLEDTFSGNALALGTERVTAQGESISKLENHVGFIELFVPFHDLALALESARGVEFGGVETSGRGRRIETACLTRGRPYDGNRSGRSGMLSDRKT
jgi:hypothetical protein